MTEQEIHEETFQEEFGMTEQQASLAAHYVCGYTNKLDAELKEAEKALKQNESAIRMLAKQRDEMDAKLKEAREIIKSSKRDKALLIDFVDVTISYKKELKAGILQIDQWLENNQEKHKPQCRICGATHGVNMGLCVDCTLAVMPTP